MGCLAASWQAVLVRAGNLIGEIEMKKLMLLLAALGLLIGGIALTGCPSDGDDDDSAAADDDDATAGDDDDSA